MPKVIPEVTLRDPIEADISGYEVQFSPDLNNPGEEVVRVLTRYNLVDDSGDVFEADKVLDQIDAPQAVVSTAKNMRKNQLLKEVEEHEDF